MTQKKPDAQSIMVTNATDACRAIDQLYTEQVSIIRDGFDAFSKGHKPTERIHGFYPLLRLNVKSIHRQDTRMSFGFVPKTGSYTTTLTRPDVFANYYKDQIELLFTNHEATLEVTLSTMPIALPFALGEDFYAEEGLSEDDVKSLPDYFDMPDLDIIDDEVANSMVTENSLGERPLALFNAARVDLSMQRLKHYTGTRPAHFQNFVIYTNYQFYIDEFIKMSEAMMQDGNDDYYAFVQPGDQISFNIHRNDRPDFAEDKSGKPMARLPQMPAYHLKRKDGSGITMINIGVGPSNAKTISDHVAVLRPHAWIMLGHCAGLRNSQSLGDYVLAHAYLRHDNVLDDDLPPFIPLPALAEIQTALQVATGEITGLEKYEVKKMMRTGTVATIDDRNWEFREAFKQNRTLSLSRAIGLDMESGTLAANGFRFRVPYGTLLCVSDKPLHGQLKLPGMANNFYRERVEQHLKIGLRTMEILREYGINKLHSRKLRSFNEVAFQ